LQFLAGSSLSLSGIFITLFEQHAYNHHSCLQDVQQNLHIILNTILHNPSTHEKVLSWTIGVSTDAYCRELTSLAEDDTLHFNARRATASKLEDFSIGKLALKMQTLSPKIWSLLDSMLEADPFLVQRRKGYAARGSHRNQQTMDSSLNDSDNGGDNDELEDIYGQNLVSWRKSRPT